MTPEERATAVCVSLFDFKSDRPFEDRYVERPADEVRDAIEEAIEAAIAEEREACAKTVETLAYGAAAAAIRARR